VLDDESLTAALAKAPPLNFLGHTYRVIDDEFRTDPLSGIGSVLKGGRYNSPHTFEALYTSDSRVTALHEVAALFGDVDAPRSPELILTVDVRLTRVLDLTDEIVCKLLGIATDDLAAPFLEDQLRGGEAATQRLERLIFTLRRFSALRVPSAARVGAENLVILPARLGRGELVRLHDERGRWRQIRVGSPG